MKPIFISLVVLTFYLININSSHAVMVKYTGAGGTIPDNCYPDTCNSPSLDEFTSSVFVVEDFKLAAVIFKIDWSHSASTDIVDFVLDGPSGRADVAGERPCMRSGEFIFSDSASTGLNFLMGQQDCVFGLSPSGEYTPVDSFSSVFGGQSSHGLWSVSIFDGFSQDEGFVNSWELTLISVPSPATTLMSLTALAFLLVSRKRQLMGKG